MPPRGNSVRAGGAFVEITARVARGFRGVLASIRARIGKLSRTLGSAASRIGAAAGAALIPIALLVKKFASLGDQIAKTAKRTGVSTQAISRLKFAAEQSGASLENVEAGLKRMSRFLIDSEDGLTTNVRAMDRLGLKVKDFQGLDPEQSFALLSEALSKVASKTEQAALAQVVLGRAGTMLLPLINEGAKGLAKYGAEAKELGVVMDKETAQAAEDLTDGFNRVKTAALGLAIAVGKTLAGDVLDLTQRLVGGIKALGQWVQANREALIQAVATAGKMLALAAALKVAAIVLAGIALLLTPGGAILAGLALLAATVPSVRESFKDMLDLSADEKIHLSILDRIRIAWLKLKAVILKSIITLGEGAGKLLLLFTFGDTDAQIRKDLDQFARAKAQLENDIIQAEGEARSRSIIGEVERKEKRQRDALKKVIDTIKAKPETAVAAGIGVAGAFIPGGNLLSGPIAAALLAARENAKRLKATEANEKDENRDRVRRRTDQSSQVTERLRTVRRERARAGVDDRKDAERQSTRERLGLPEGETSVLGTFSGRFAAQMVGGQKTQRKQLDQLSENGKTLEKIERNTGRGAVFG